MFGGMVIDAPIITLLVSVSLFDPGMETSGMMPLSEITLMLAPAAILLVVILLVWGLIRIRRTKR